MNARLKYVVDVIDASIKSGMYIKSIHSDGLCQQIIRDGKKMPVKYVGGGDSEVAGINDNNAVCTYHRMLDDNTDTDSSQGFGNNILNTQTYQMKMVVMVDLRRVKDTNYDTTYLISDELQRLFPKILTKTQRDDISAMMCTIGSFKKNLESAVVLQEEYEDAENKIEGDKRIFSIAYNIIVKSYENCLTVSCS